MLQIKLSPSDATTHQPTDGEDTSVQLHSIQGKSSSYSPSCKYINLYIHAERSSRYLTKNSLGFVQIKCGYIDIDLLDIESETKRR